MRKVSSVALILKEVELMGIAVVRPEMDRLSGAFWVVVLCIEELLVRDVLLILTSSVTLILKEVELDVV